MGLIIKEKITKDFLIAFSQLQGQQSEEIIWNGSQDFERGFKLMGKHIQERIELGIKYGVIEK